MDHLTIRLGTRGSQLALAQSNWVADQLRSIGHQVELIELKTEGDVRTGPLAQIGGQGLFTKRLQQALLDNEIDLAVHSLKDLPTEDHPDLSIAAVPEREDPADALIGRTANRLDDLPQAARIGTGSVRRAAQLLHRRPDLQVLDVRGNVETRIRKLETESLDAIVLACAGLNRLGLSDRITQRFEEVEILPAVGQGALGLECRAADTASIDVIKTLNHRPSFHRAMAERSLLRTLFAGCLAPVGSSTVCNEDGTLCLTGVVLSPDGRQRVEATRTGTLDSSQRLGIEVAEALLELGAGPLLKQGTS